MILSGKYCIQNLNYRLQFFAMYRTYYVRLYTCVL